jgi:hypothetical protein
VPRLFRERSGPIEAATQSRQHLLVEDRRRDALRSGIDDEPDRVRSDVDNANRFAVFQGQGLTSAVETQLRNSPAFL